MSLERGERKLGRWRRVIRKSRAGKKGEIEEARRVVFWNEGGLGKTAEWGGESKVRVKKVDCWRRWRRVSVKAE